MNLNHLHRDILIGLMFTFANKPIFLISRRSEILLELFDRLWRDQHSVMTLVPNGEVASSGLTLILVAYHAREVFWLVLESQKARES